MRRISKILQQINKPCCYVISFTSSINGVLRTSCQVGTISDSNDSHRGILLIEQKIIDIVAQKRNPSIIFNITFIKTGIMLGTLDIESGLALRIIHDQAAIQHKIHYQFK